MKLTLLHKAYKAVRSGPWPPPGTFWCALPSSHNTVSCRMQQKPFFWMLSWSRFNSDSEDFLQAAPAERTSPSFRPPKFRVHTRYVQTTSNTYQIHSTGLEGIRNYLQLYTHTHSFCRPCESKVQAAWAFLPKYLTTPSSKNTADFYVFDKNTAYLWNSVNLTLIQYWMHRLPLFKFGQLSQ